MKKIIIAMMIALIPTLAFAGVFDIAYGINLEQTQTVDKFAEGLNWGKVETGYEIRSRVWIFGLDSVTKVVNTSVENNSPTAFLAKTDLGLNLSFGLGSILRLGLGINTQPYQFAIGGEGAQVKGFGAYPDAAVENFVADLLNQKFIYKATMDVSLGDMLLGFTYKMGSNFNINSFTETIDWAQFIPQFAEGTIAVSVLYSFF